jgi:hypothetical protein
VDVQYVANKKPKKALPPLTLNQFIQKAISVHSNKYDYSKVVYKNQINKIIIICPEHGEFKQRPNNHLYNNAGCPKCAKNQKLTLNQFIQKAISVHGNKYDYSKVNYINSKVNVIIVCHKHGKFLQTPERHWINRGCPLCNESYGNKLISKSLKKLNINFIIEFKYKDLRGFGGGLLRFDFYLPKYDICIEYDGPQHFSKKQHDILFKNKSDYNILKIHDRLKTKYCRKHKIKLIRIPYYYQYKIPKILASNIK